MEPLAFELHLLDCTDIKNYHLAVFLCFYMNDLNFKLFKAKHYTMNNTQFIGSSRIFGYAVYCNIIKFKISRDLCCAAHGRRYLLSWWCTVKLWSLFHCQGLILCSTRQTFFAVVISNFLCTKNQPRSEYFYCPVRIKMFIPFFPNGIDVETHNSTMTSG